MVLKLKTAPDVANGILDQYELGPYNLIIMGEPSRWRGEFMAFFRSGVVQTVTTMAPCSVLVARNSLDKKGFFICTDGSSRSMQAVRRAAVLADVTRRADHAVLGGRHRGRQARRGRGGGQCQGAAQGHEDPGRGNPRRGRQSGRRKSSRADRSTRSSWSPTRAARGSQRLVRGSTATEVVRKARTSVLDVR